MELLMHLSTLGSYFFIAPKAISGRKETSILETTGKLLKIYQLHVENQH